MSDLDTLYAYLEAGDAPLSVVADWYEENGHELAVGVRWLADAGKWPDADVDRWWWYRRASGLSAVEALPPQPLPLARHFPSLRTAIMDAAEAVQEVQLAPS